MLKKNNNKNKGFSLIELILVMGIMAILVLLAMPNLVKSKNMAKLTQIKSDIRAAEGVVDEQLMKYGNFPNDWKDVSAGELRIFTNQDKTYDKTGLITTIDEGIYKEMNTSFLKKKISTKLKGKFYSNKDGIICYIDDKALSLGNLTEKDFDFTREPQNIDKNDNSKLSIIYYELPNGIYKYGDTAKGKFKIKGIKEGNYQIKITLTHSKAGLTLNNTEDFSIAVGEIKDIDYGYLFVSPNRLGFYDVKVSINDGSNIITSYYMPKTIYLGSEHWEYFYEDDFNKMSMPSIGGIGNIVPENVDFNYVEDASLGDYSSAILNVTPNTTKTGQIATKLPMTYGSYEARIKVPDSDSLLNGLFLYGCNKYDSNISYEIDIEILYMDSKWQVWTTIFNPTHKDYKKINDLEPGAIYHSKTDIDFDPSASYNNYRINFYKNYISFVVNDTEISRWKGSFDYFDMSLYASTFYTHWLGKNISTEHKQMDVQWVRRAYIPN